jgi:malate dehydrogenase (oxaloacetate-decarboxylating)
VRVPRLAVIGDDAPAEIAGLEIVPSTTALLSEPRGVDAVYLCGMDQAAARRAKAAFTAGIPCLTREELTAVGLAGRLLVLLARSGRPPLSARVVVVESTAIPTLCPLLLAIGVGDIVSWEPTDALSYSLRSITYRSDAVIDPWGGGVPLVLPSDEPGQPPLIAADDPAYPVLALPGLVRALLDRPGARADFDVLRACVRALVARTGNGRWLPDQSDPELTPTVSAMAGCALAAATRNPQSPL